MLSFATNGQWPNSNLGSASKGQWEKARNWAGDYQQQVVRRILPQKKSVGVKIKARKG